MNDMMPHSLHEGYCEVNDTQVKGHGPGNYEHDGISRSMSIYKLRPMSPYRDEEQDDQSSDSGPSMTTASSGRSASCSVIQCDSCEGSNDPEKCVCPDSGRLRYLQMSSDNSSTRARSQSPAAFIDRFRFQKSPLHHGIYFSSPPSRARSSPLANSAKFLSDQHREEPNILQRVPSPVQEVEGLDGMDLETTPTALISDEVSSNVGDNSDARSESEEEDESDQQSTQDDELEAMVLKALGNDLGLAAHLIPILHKSLYMEPFATIKQKVDPWRNAINTCSPGGGAAQTPSVNSQAQEGGSSRKRRRPGSNNFHRDRDEEEENEEEEDEDNQGSKDVKDDGEAGPFKELPRLACPFHKKNPRKYCIQHDLAESSKKHEYRSCEGPGFTSIQRLKEHLKRKHYPVQCDRCYAIFPGSDRAKCVTALEAHRQQPIPCERGQSDLKEGISDAKWAQLEKKKTVKQSKESSRIEKYWEIWDILFPGVTRPNNPWYDNRNATQFPPPLSPESRHFSSIFSGMLELQVRDQLIRFPEGFEHDMKARIEAIAQRAFELYVRINTVQSSRASTSSRSQPQSSLIGGSYDHVSIPGTTDGSRSGSRSLSINNQLQAIDMQSSVASTPLRTHSRDTGSSMRPPVMSTRQQMAQPNYVPTMSNHPQQGPEYSMGYPNSIPTFSNSFNNNLAPNNGGWNYGGYEAYPSGINHQYTDNNPAGTYRPSPEAAIAQDMMVSSDPAGQGLLAWTSDLDPGNMQYQGGQRSSSY